MMQDLSPAEYRCPGETYSISRAVHLGRLSRFHPACRECPRREDTVGLSASHIRRLAEFAAQSRQPLIFHSEGAGSRSISDLGPQLARRIAIEFGRRLQNAAGDVGQVANLPERRQIGNPPHVEGSQTTAIVAGDGRPAAAEIIAALCDGLRWTGCDVIDIGPASGPCTARAIEHLLADGGIFVGRAPCTHGRHHVPSARADDSGEKGDERLVGPHSVGLKFWSRVEPLSQGSLLDDIEVALQADRSAEAMDRPTRRFGPLRRFAATEVYLSDFRPAYHALRPLRFVVDCRLEPVFGYLDDLLKHVACRTVRADTEVGDIGRQVVKVDAHFGIQIDDDGENCRVFDELGRAVETGRLLEVVGTTWGRLPTCQKDGRLAICATRQQTFLRMRRSGSAIAADAAGRLWYADNHAPRADALQTLTRLLVLLSREDIALSAVLDRARTAQ
jgi:hypothetical protein